MNKKKLTIDSLLEIIKEKKNSAECEKVRLEKYEERSFDYEDVPSQIKELTGEINAYTDLIALIESRKATPKLEKMIFCTIKYSCVDCPNYNKTCGGRK